MLYENNLKIPLPILWNLGNLSTGAFYSTPTLQLGTKECAQGYGYILFARNLSNKYEEKILDTATKTEFDAAKAASKN